ncbi:MAG: hypothetical protein Kow0079_12590 [Vicingaceae bacterium]
MFPYLSDLINYLFGTNLKLPFPMFGFMVALAFLAANYFFKLELKRKEEEGLLKAFKEKVIIGEKPKPIEIITNAVFGFLFGFKIVGMIQQYDLFVQSPPDYIFSTNGNAIAGIILGIAFGYWKYYEKNKAALEQPEEKEECVHPYQLVGNMTVIAAIAGILGAKLFHNLENINELIDNPLGALTSFSGLSIYGGLIVGGISVVWYAKKKGLKIVHVVDACAPALILAYAIGRIGCQLAGDGDWGQPNDSPMPDWLSFLPEWMWAFDYPNNVLGIDLKQDFMQMGYESITGKAWPTPFYETLMALFIFGILWSLRKKFKYPGFIFSLYLFLNGIERFLIEQIRINPPYHFLGIEATQAEIIAVILFISGIAGMYLSIKKSKHAI